MSELNFGCGLYVLDPSGENPKRCNDIGVWAEWYQKFDRRRVKKTILGEMAVSTIFLGVDHGVDTSHPVLWETMVFRLKEDDMEVEESLECERCAGNREQALAMHAAMCAKVKALEPARGSGF